ncbi:MAG: hypothetical protein ACRDG9_11510 [Actinomycetota bacterium]
MRRDAIQYALGVALLGAFAAFWRWHSPKAQPLTKGEVDRYMEIISKLPLPGDEGEKFVARLRPWAEADDGKPFLMLNMIRFYDELHRYPGAPKFDGTPEDSNAYYEKQLTSLWLKNASYPVLGGAVQGKPRSRPTRRMRRGARRSSFATRAGASSSSCCPTRGTGRSSPTRSCRWSST